MDPATIAALTTVTGLFFGEAVMKEAGKQSFGERLEVKGDAVFGNLTQEG
jgi:hypothetical protein